MFRRKKLSLEVRNNRLGIYLLSPSIIFVGLFVLFPIAYNIFLSFHFSSMFDPKNFSFVGLENYIRILTSEVFWSALKNASVYTFSSVILQLILGLMIALLLNKKFYGRNIVRGIVLFPYLVPTICAVFMARWMFEPNYGIINFFFRSVLGFSINWLGNPNTAMLSLILVNTWKFFPFVEIALLARLQNIPLTLYEAADVDGASSFQQFIHITLPELIPIIFVSGFLRTIWTFNDFQLVHVLTRGGPVRSTETVPLLAYRYAFSNGNIGMGSTVAMFMAMFLFITFIFYYKIFDPLNENR